MWILFAVASGGIALSEAGGAVTASKPAGSDFFCRHSFR